MHSDMGKVDVQRSPVRYALWLLFVAVVIFFSILPWTSVNRARFGGAVGSFLILSIILYLRRKDLAAAARLFFDRHRPLIESRAEAILGGFIFIMICWCGLDIFANPYLYE